MTEPQRAGFATVLGAPNAGKSTLVNTLVGAKVSIVSPKVQTTRSLVRGIMIHKQSQVVLVDTPGIFQPRRRLDRAMVAAAWTGAADGDQVLLLVDAKRGLDDDTARIVDSLKEQHRDAWLVLNKVDVAEKNALLALAGELTARATFSETFMISALTGDGVDRLQDALADAMPKGPWLYPEDEISDLPLKMLAAEISREQVYMALHQELPYQTMVDTDAWEERDDGSVRIDQTLYVTRDSQKPIVLGAKGQRLKSIGSKARTELENLLDRKVHLFLHVKVDPKWPDRRGHFADWGLDFNA